MRVLALDIGEKRCGVAYGDTISRIALPISMIQTNEILAYSSEFRRIIEDHEPEILLVGLPISLDGQENQQAKKVKEQAESIAETLGLPLVYQDERLSSAEAKRFLREAGCTERQMRGKIDMLAASVVLQAYLDSEQIEHQGSVSE